ncbi:hypothetical protein BL250_15145 [Erwinia sp. OLTSP20]|uniref:Csu type fimbrial protein n=1 Tax=unclassified Erwinia TaxID=2622719 RepID=UPI000C51FE15|nr:MULTISPECIES: spore coat protein U domain-containing protein [unclassified Erwinia]PIJ48481.1 hypothetical protein BV501_16950 [Erwinia sp. OAMSP11]PIJ75977.1 hypothetical protein BK416_00355 [Erwinia sp. OLSSP12]PIJ78877.1 hypothetical protein BLD47_16300 [Erwinia sp. OLCASP19]PIJ87433.1 hypothetical protein BLD46_00355 [Erwinia sp. OLMTSP26]PIJ88983.1 hypothetical protein BLD49_00355 [Erwinia sp. OLMDSP33]
MIRHCPVFPALLLSAFYAATAQAEDVQGQITVNADVAASCEVATSGSTTPLTGNFGKLTFDTSSWMSGKPIASAPDNLTITCTAGNAPVVKIDQGENYDPDAKSWRMKNKADGMLDYKLFSDAALATEITPNVDINTKKANPFALTLYGQMQAIPAGKDIPAGSYNDTLNMTISWTG